jgi:hypothetical protein
MVHPGSGALEIHTDPRFTRRMWRFQRAGWIVLAALVAAGTLGAFGDGVIARRTAESADGTLAVEHERFVRRRAPSGVRIHVRASGDAGPLRIWIDREYLEAIELRRITPEPESQRVGDDRCELEFERLDGARTAEIALDFDVREAGRFRGRIGSGEASVLLDQFAYP